MKNVLIDMSPLDTPSRLRGIGQYILGLASGLLALQREQALDLSVSGIAQFDWLGRTSGPVGLGYAGSHLHPDKFATWKYRLRKLHGLAPAAWNLGAQLLHVTEPYAMPTASRVPMVVTCHDLIPLVLHNEYLAPVPWARISRMRTDTKRYRAAQRILAVSHATRADLIQYLHIDSDRIDVAQLGIDHERFRCAASGPGERARLEERYQLSRPFLLYVGAYDMRKNVGTLIRAFAQAGLAKDFDLVLAGAMQRKYLHQLIPVIRATATQAAVKMIGYVEEEDLAALYRTCHLHVFPSRYEGFGLPVAEAMACGAPTVAIRASSVPEVAGDAAYLVPVDDLDALTEAIRTLCYDDSRRRDLSLRGPLAAQRFQWKECARQTIESYKKALA